MPVVFAPMEPLDTGVSAGVGYQHRQDQLREQARQDAAVGQRQQALDQHAYEYGNEPYRRQQDLQDRLAYEAQHVHQEYTINDEMDKQRLDNARADLDSRVRNGELLPEDAAPAYKDLEKPTWLLQRKKALSDQQKEQAQVEALKRQNEHQATADATYQTFMAKAGVNGITTIPDPDNPEDVLRDRATGEPLHFQWNHRQGQMAPLEKPTSSARVPSHAGWTDKQIDDAAHARAVQGRPEWQANPQAAKAHPDYVDEYAKHRSNVLTSLYYGETTEPDENGDRKQKKANGEWAPVEGSKATIAAAKPQKPAPAERAPQFVEKAELDAAKASVLAGNPAWAGQSAAHLADNKDFNQQVAAEFAAREQLHGQRLAEWRRKQPGGQPAAPPAEAAQGQPAPPPIPAPPAGAGTEADVDAAIRRAKAKAAPNGSEYDTPVRWQ